MPLLNVVRLFFFKMLRKHEQDEDEDGSTIKFQTLYGHTKL